MTAGLPSAAADGELPPRVVMACMAGVMAAMLMSALDSTIVETAMPQAIAEMNGFEHYTAVVTMYLLASTAIVPIVGKLSDLYGRKPFLLTGVAIFVVGSALCGAAQSMLQLVAFRGFQGIGAGFTQAMAFTTIGDLFPPARRGRVMGLMGSVFGFATVVGPTVGGILTDGPGWRWCFYVNLPVGIAAFLVLLFMFPQLHTPKKERTIDWIGALLLLMGVVPILLGLSWAGRDYAWGSPVTIGLLGGGALVSLIFLVFESRTVEPILPLSLFANRVVWTSAVGAMTMAVGMFGTILFIPLFMQAVLGRSATQSGAVLTPLMVSLVAASMVSGQLLTKMGRYKAIAVVGSTITIVGIFLLSRMTVETTYAVTLRNMIIVGLGIGSTLPVFNIAIQNAVRIEQLGVATSALQFLRSMGGSLGAAVFGAVLINRFSGAFHRAIPPQVLSDVGPDIIRKFENPQALMNPQIMADVQSGAVPDAGPLLLAVRHGLASALQDVFLCAAIVGLVGLVASLMLVDVPLRQTNRIPTPASDDEVPVMPATTFEM